MKNTKIIMGISVIVVAVVLLGFLMVKNFLTTNYSVGDFLNKRPSLTEKTVRVGGLVLPGIQHDVTQSLLTFSIADKTNLANTLLVSYHGASIPDAFKEGQDVIVEGKYPGSGAFQATSLITKCPSKYTVATTTASK